MPQTIPVNIPPSIRSSASPSTERIDSTNTAAPKVMPTSIQVEHSTFCVSIEHRRRHSGRNTRSVGIAEMPPTTIITCMPGKSCM